MVLRRVTAILAGLALAGLGVAAGAPTASAGTGTGCYESSCNGLDPTTSYNSHTGYECDTAATDPSNTSPAQPYSTADGLLELRWGPDCAVNWARFTPSNNAEYRIYVQSGSTTEYYVFSNSSGVSRYSNEVYSPGPAEACVDLYYDHAWYQVACLTQSS